MIKIYNTMTRKKEVFKPIKKGLVKLFVCGPTVYDYSHIGHARTYIAFDIIARYLKYRGFTVFYLQNITDIDDKIIKRASDKDVNPDKLARRFEEEYMVDMEILGVDSVTFYARATLHIPEIIEQIKILIKKGYAYETRNGVYFDESQFPDYGKLSKRKIEDLTVSRIKSDLNKINPGDFALWKIKDDPPTWKSPWGKGRPGWHIEDTAITEEYFGPQYDIHGGGLDLIFPHHEAEIAQMESISGFKPMVRYWMHTGFLNVDGEKMSKSLGNFITIKKLLQEYDPQSFRFFVLSTHYRSPIDFNDKILKQAHKSIMRMKKFIHRLSELDLEEYGEDDNILINDVDKTREKFMDAMNDDFNTPLAISIIFDFIRNFNKVLDRDLMSNHSLNQVQKVIIEFGEILGLKLTPEDDEDHKDEKLIEIITDVRQKLRDKSEWDLADDIRDQLRKMDITLEDS